MKIKPDDPAWEMTIRLKLAVEMMKNPHLIWFARELNVDRLHFTDMAFHVADAIIERANREEGESE